MNESINIEALMAESGVKFGTSGARGLVVQMSDRVCFAYTSAFLLYLRDHGLLKAGCPVAISGDLRPSTPRIAEAVARAARHLGHELEFCGWVPSPALVLRGLEQGIPAVMVTGSHIPDDRNGIKFNSPQGEITKVDEEGIRGYTVKLPDFFDESGSFRADSSESSAALPEPSEEALVSYKNRFLEAFPSQCLQGIRLGVYGHSAVGRDFLVELYEAMGALVTPLGFSQKFVPVDTEAIRPEDVELAAEWAKEQALDAIVSTDGDSDRPLISDELGRWIRGDVAGIVTASYLGANAVALPVSCNSAVEKSSRFERVLRTRIGSPFVIAAMAELRERGASAVVGYEANGGFLSFTELSVPRGNSLSALPTRDAVIVHLGLLLAAKDAGTSLSELFSKLPQRFTASDRDPSFASERSARLLALLRGGDQSTLETEFSLGKLIETDETDGLRFTFESLEVIHLRPSGNAPELRCYAEADTEARAEELVSIALAAAARLSP